MEVLFESRPIYNMAVKGVLLTPMCDVPIRDNSTTWHTRSSTLVDILYHSLSISYSLAIVRYVEQNNSRNRGEDGQRILSKIWDIFNDCLQ
jgi:hypothetical protein